VVQTIEQPSPVPEKAPMAAIEKITEQAAEEKPAQPQDEPPVTSKDDAPVKPSMAPTHTPVAAPEEAAAVSRERPGHYIVKQGDTLSKISARQDTLQDPLKWPILLRLNSEKLGDLPLGADFATRELPTGMELKYITPGEAKEGLNKPPESIWVVNVMSAPTEAELVPSAVILSRQGYPVYIRRANVKGKDYLRLRVGFFESRKESIDEGEKIKGLLKSKDFWATRANDGEYQEVAGFLKTP